MSGNVISIRNNFPAIAAKLDQLSFDIGKKALVRALNTTMDQGKTEMARQISREFRVSVSTAKDRLEVRRAFAGGRGSNVKFEAVLAATSRRKGRSMNLIAFVTGGAPSRTKKGVMRQLKLKIKRSGGNKSITGAFIGNEGRTVFIREGKGRLPIKAVNTIDVPQMFNTKRINSVVRSVMLKRFEANFNRELRSVMKGYVK